MVSLLKKLLGRNAPQSSSPLYEVSAHDYFSEKLREDDMQPLRNLIDALVSGFESQGIEAAILAVGSSTYPDEHWEYIADVNEQEGREVRSAHYIDLGSRTGVDIIFRPEGAREALREERLYNNAFSLLYQASGITSS